MSNARPIIIPRETINDDSVVIVRWNVKTGDAVKANDVLLEMETSKAVVDLLAESDGYVEILRHAGDQVEVGSEVGVLRSEASRPAPRAESGVAAAAAPRAAGRQQMISKKAQALIDEHGLNPADFDLEVVKEADVQQYLDRRAASPTTAAASA